MQSSILKGITSMYQALFTGPAWDHLEREPGDLPGTSGIVFGWLIIGPGGHGYSEGREVEEETGVMRSRD